MNMSQYKWPVIIAAGLHGALFLSFPPDRVVLPPVKKAPAPVDEAPRIEMDRPEVLEAGSSAESGGGEAVPTLAEVLAPPELKAPFEIPTVSRTAPDKPIPDLRSYRGGEGPGPGTGPTFGIPSVAPAGVLDRPPHALAQPSPSYPYSMRQEGAHGSVTVEFIVGVDGYVLSASAVKWTRREFVDAAVAAVLRWRFEPGTLEGRKVRFRMAVPIEFNAAG